MLIRTQQCSIATWRCFHIMTNSGNDSVFQNISETRFHHTHWYFANALLNTDVISERISKIPYVTSSPGGGWGSGAETTPVL